MTQACTLLPYLDNITSHTVPHSQSYLCTKLIAVISLHSAQYCRAYKFGNIWCLSARLIILAGIARMQHQLKAMCLCMAYRRVMTVCRSCGPGSAQQQHLQRQAPAPSPLQAPLRIPQLLKARQLLKKVLEKLNPGHRSASPILSR